MYEYLSDAFVQTNVFRNYIKTYRLNRDINGERIDNASEEEIAKIEKTNKETEKKCISVKPHHPKHWMQMVFLFKLESFLC